MGLILLSCILELEIKAPTIQVGVRTEKWQELLDTQKKKKKK